MVPFRMCVFKILFQTGLVGERRGWIAQLTPSAMNMGIVRWRRLAFVHSGFPQIGRLLTFGSSQLTPIAVALNILENEVSIISGQTL